jgi:hypothetical protein
LSTGKVSVWYPCVQNVEKRVSKCCFELNKSKQTDPKIEAALFPSFFLSSLPSLSISLMFVVVPNALAPVRLLDFSLEENALSPFLADFFQTTTIDSLQPYIPFSASVLRHYELSLA